MRKTFSVRILAAVAVLGLVAAACSSDEEAATTTTTTAAAAQLDIVDTAVEAGSFTTLVAAVEAAGLVETLKGEGPFTVFAPTDEAFDALPEGTVEGLLQDIPALREILLYHVVAGAVPASEVANLTTATTVQGSDIDIVFADGTVTIDGATVVTTDIQTSNGIIHVIDQVILP